MNEMAERGRREKEIERRSPCGGEVMAKGNKGQVTKGGSAANVTETKPRSWCMGSNIIC